MWLRLKMPLIWKLHKTSFKTKTENCKENLSRVTLIKYLTYDAPPILVYLINNRYLWYIEFVNAYKSFAFPEMRQRCRLIKIVNYLWAKTEPKCSYIRVILLLTRTLRWIGDTALPPRKVQTRGEDVSFLRYHVHRGLEGGWGELGEAIAGPCLVAE